MADHYILMMYYAKYLKEIRGVSDSTVKHYQGALKHISRYLVKKEKLKETVYEIQNIESLERIREYLYTDPEFLALDNRGHQMYSAGLNNYYKFAEGVGFYNIDNPYIYLYILLLFEYFYLLLIDEFLVFQYID